MERHGAESYSTSTINSMHGTLLLPHISSLLGQGSRAGAAADQFAEKFES